MVRLDEAEDEAEDEGDLDRQVQLHRGCYWSSMAPSDVWHDHLIRHLHHC